MEDSLIRVGCSSFFTEATGEEDLSSETPAQENNVPTEGNENGGHEKPHENGVSEEPLENGSRDVSENDQCISGNNGLSDVEIIENGPLSVQSEINTVEDQKDYNERGHEENCDAKGMDEDEGAKGTHEGETELKTPDSEKYDNLINSVKEFVAEEMEENNEDAIKNDESEDEKAHDVSMSVFHIGLDESFHEYGIADKNTEELPSLPVPKTSNSKSKSSRPHFLKGKKPICKRVRKSMEKISSSFGSLRLRAGEHPKSFQLLHSVFGEPEESAVVCTAVTPVGSLPRRLIPYRLPKPQNPNESTTSSSEQLTSGNDSEKAPSDDKENKTDETTNSVINRSTNWYAPIDIQNDNDEGTKVPEEGCLKKILREKRGRRRLNLPEVPSKPPRKLNYIYDTPKSVIREKLEELEARDNEKKAVMIADLKDSDVDSESLLEFANSLYDLDKLASFHSDNSTVNTKENDMNGNPYSVIDENLIESIKKKTCDVSEGDKLLVHYEKIQDDDSSTSEADVTQAIINRNKNTPLPPTPKPIENNTVSNLDEPKGNLISSDLLAEVVDELNQKRREEENPYALLDESQMTDDTSFTSGTDSETDPGEKCREMVSKYIDKYCIPLDGEYKPMRKVPTPVLDMPHGDDPDNDLMLFEECDIDSNDVANESISPYDLHLYYQNQTYGVLMDDISDIMSCDNLSEDEEDIGRRNRRLTKKRAKPGYVNMKRADAPMGEESDDGYMIPRSLKHFFDR